MLERSAEGIFRHGVKAQPASEDAQLVPERRQVFMTFEPGLQEVHGISPRILREELASQDEARSPERGVAFEGISHVREHAILLYGGRYRRRCRAGRCSQQKDQGRRLIHTMEDLVGNGPVAASTCEEGDDEGSETTHSFTGPGRHGFEGVGKLDGASASAPLRGGRIELSQHVPPCIAQREVESGISGFAADFHPNAKGSPRLEMYFTDGHLRLEVETAVSADHLDVADIDAHRRIGGSPEPDDGRAGLFGLHRRFGVPRAGLIDRASKLNGARRKLGLPRRLLPSAGSEIVALGQPRIGLGRMGDVEALAREGTERPCHSPAKLGARSEELAGSLFAVSGAPRFPLQSPVQRVSGGEAKLGLVLLEQAADELCPSSEVGFSQQTSDRFLDGFGEDAALFGVGCRLEAR